jgi:hypothetical protein
MSTDTDALKAEQTDVKDKGYGSATFNGQEFPIAQRPNPLLLSELARTGSGEPEAMAVIADFFENTLVDYRAFKKAVYASPDEVDEKALMGVLQEILEKTMGRPTE